MKVTTATPASGAPASLNATWTIATVNAGDGRRYQQRFTLNLATGGHAEELRIDDATRMRCKALGHGFDARDPQAPERAQVAGLDGDPTGLRVTLPVARLISSIRFDPGTWPGGKTTEIYRTDGDVVAEEPVASWLNPFTIVVQLAEQRTAQPEPAPRAAPGFGIEVAEQPAHEVGFAEQGLSIQGLASGELDVVDSRFVVRLRGASAVALTPSNLTAVNLTTAPENLRVGLRLPALGSEIFFLPLTFEPNQQVDAGEALRDQLAALLVRLRDALGRVGDEGPPVPLPDPLAVELVIEGDAPCRVAISQFELHYQLVRASFPDGAPKQVLRFGDRALAPQRLGLKLPGAVSLTRATLTLAGDGSAAATSAGAAATPAALGALLETPTTNGLQVDTRRRWASPLALAEPILGGGCDLLLAGLAPQTRLRLELVADREGQPGGELLAAAEATLDPPRRRRLVRFVLAEPPLLQPGSYWLLLECREGAAVWYLRPSVGERVLQLRDHDWHGIDAIVEQSGAAAWVAADGLVAAERRFPEIRLDGQPLPLLQRDSDWVYDLAPALAASPAGGGLVERALEILATGARPITIYPPQIEYEL